MGTGLNLSTTTRKNDVPYNNFASFTSHSCLNFSRGRHISAGEIQEILKTKEGEVSLQSQKKDAMRHSHDIQIVFISMEPKSFFVPQYLDSEMVFYYSEVFGFLVIPNDSVC